MNQIVALGLAYLYVLGAVGCVSALVALRRIAESKQWGQPLRCCVIGAHFTLGMTAVMVAPTAMWVFLGDDVTDELGLTYVIGGAVSFVLLIVAFKAAGMISFHAESDASREGKQDK